MFIDAEMYNLYVFQHLKLKNCYVFLAKELKIFT